MVHFINSNFKRGLFNAATIFLLSVLIVGASIATAQGSTPESVIVGGVSRPYFVYLPQSYNPNQAFPIVYVLHPMLTSAKWAEKSMGWDQCADKNGFIVVYGQSGLSNGEWNTGLDPGIAKTGPDDVGYLEAVIQTIRRTYRIDKSRVYIVGFSSGAIMAGKMGATIPDTLTAIGTVEGMTGYGNFDAFIPNSPVSMIEFRGTLDRIIPYESVVYPAVNTAYDWAKADGCSLTPSLSSLDNGGLQFTDYTGGADKSEVVLATVNGGHHAYKPEFTDIIWRFFASHRK